MPYGVRYQKGEVHGLFTVVRPTRLLEGTNLIYVVWCSVCKHVHLLSSARMHNLNKIKRCPAAPRKNQHNSVKDRIRPGRLIGAWKVLGPAGHDKGGKALIQVECTCCGNTYIRRLDILEAGGSKQCRSCSWDQKIGG